MSEHFDALETRDEVARAIALAQDLPQAIAMAQRGAHWREALAGVDAARITDVRALASLPVTRKSDLVARQAAAPPFGGLYPLALGGLARVYASPGPIHEAEADTPDFWRYARALHATGLRRGALLHNCFAYHFTPAGMMLEGGARALGCPVFPGGTGNTEAQARAAAHLRPDCYAGTPDFLKAILEAGDALGLDLTCFTRAHVTGGAFFPALRDWYAARGLTVLQSYGSADLGCIAYESPAREGLIVEEGVVVEICRPGTGDPLPDGEVGEVIVTTLSTLLPMIRFATGDLSAILPGPSPCGRSNTRIRGWLGRADQATKVRGMFVRPEQVAALLRAHPEVTRARLVVTREGDRDVMVLKAEAASPALAERVAETLQSVTRLNGAVTIVSPGSLPNDGKLIDDMRPPPQG